MENLVTYLAAKYEVSLHRLQEDRGDVPGWVLVTLMTAGICVALWAVAEDAIIGLFQRAIDTVTKGH